MKKISWVWGLCGVLLIFLGGCYRIIDWSKDTFYQGCFLDNEISVARQYIRTLKIYDQFDTRAIFEVLWLSDTVREVYSMIHAMHFGKDEDQKKNFLRRQLEASSHAILFYVLSLFENPLDSEDSEWTVFLTVDNTNYFPTRIKAVDMPHEYKLFWKMNQMRFKTAYEVSFDAKNSEDNCIINSNTRLLTLQFRSADKKGTVTWHIDNSGSVVCGPGTKPCYVSMRERCINGQKE
jgi:hypothetical protein